MDDPLQDNVAIVKDEPRTPSDATMTAQEAVDVLKQLAEAALLTFTPDAGRRIRAALAALEDTKIYASRFTPGQDVWCVTRDHEDCWIVWETGYCTCMGYDVFATPEAAEEEAKRRNRGK